MQTSQQQYPPHPQQRNQHAYPPHHRHPSLSQMQIPPQQYQQLTQQQVAPIGKRLSQPFGFLNSLGQRFQSNKTKGAPPQPVPINPRQMLFQRQHSLDDYFLDTPTPNTYDTPNGQLPPGYTPKMEMGMPSPFDFSKDRPTPLERSEDFEQLQEALLPSPLDFEYQAPVKIPPQLAAEQEDVAALCREFVVSQHLNDARSKTDLASRPVPLASPTQSQMKLEDPATVEVKSDASIKLQTKPTSTSSKPTSKSTKTPYKRKACTVEGCQNLSRSKGLCKAHGGGRRCSVEGCTRASQSGSLCISHGGGKRCTVPGCTKAAQSRGNCKAHGGGVRCRAPGCNKSSQGDGFCRTHGGGRRCSHESGCTKWAQRNGMCMVHSGGKYGNSYRGRMQRQMDDVVVDETA